MWDKRESWNVLKMPILHNCICPIVALAKCKGFHPRRNICWTVGLTPPDTSTVFHQSICESVKRECLTVRVTVRLWGSPSLTDLLHQTQNKWPTFSQQKKIKPLMFLFTYLSLCLPASVLWMCERWSFVMLVQIKRTAWSEGKVGLVSAAEFCQRALSRSESRPNSEERALFFCSSSSIPKDQRDCVQIENAAKERR